MSENFEVRDLRGRDRYYVDDDYIDRFAKKCGVHATAVYNSLCRHAGRDQKSWPSIDLIGEQHAIKSKHTVIKAIKTLEQFGIIKVERNKDTKTKRQSVNIYVLLHQSNWGEPSARHAPGAECTPFTDPGAFDAQKPGAPRAPEVNTVREVNTEKDFPAAGAEEKKFNALGADLIKAFETVNPACRKFYNRPPQRQACDDLIETYGFDQVLKVIAILPKTNKLGYVPVVTTPVQLWDKYAALAAGLMKLKDKRPGKAKNIIGLDNVSEYGTEPVPA